MPKVSKNARREGEKEVKSRWGGKIVLKTIVEHGRIRHYAQCEKTGVQSRKMKDLM